jgi:hypothetical protein
VFATTLLLGSVLPAAAAPPAQTFGGDPLNALPLLLPELLTMPAPARVRAWKSRPAWPYRLPNSTLQTDYLRP